MLGKCCTIKHLHEGTPIGKLTTIGGLETYTVGDESCDSVIVIATDIFGHTLVNVQLLADQMSRCGYRVIIPDILKGHPIGNETLEQWFPLHTPDITTPIFDSFLAKAREELKPKFFFGIGYCYGAKFVFEHLKEGGLLDAGAGPHPSLFTYEDVEAITKPLIISACQVDTMFPVEKRYKTEEILSKKEGLIWEINLFSGCNHGFSVRGDVTIPQVKYAKERTLTDQLNFFDQCKNQSS